MSLVEAGDPDLQVFRTLKSGPEAVPPGCFIGDGIKVVRRMLASPVRLRRLLLSPEWHERLRESIEARTDPGLRVMTAGPAVLDTIVGFRLHQGLMALGEIPPPPEAPGDLVVALDGINRAENVGAIVRSCAAFGVTALWVGPQTCSPWARRSVRVSLGAVLQVPIRPVADLAGEIRALGRPAWVGDIRGERESIERVNLTGPICLVIGGEANGPSPEILGVARRLWIPMAGGWDCLNAAAAAAVMLYEAGRQRDRA